MAGPDWLRYANQGAIRSQPISPQLLSAMSFLPELGLEMEVFSGGQAARGSGGPRTGSTRHDHGNAADVFFYKGGRRLDWSNPNDLPIFQEVVRRGRAAGLTGFGAGPGYMQPGSMHIGFGTPAVWGAGGRSANAPDWLRAAYGGAATPAGLLAGGGSAPVMAGNAGGDTLQDVPMAAPAQQLGLLALARGDASFSDLLNSGWRDRAILALEGNTLNPNVGLMAQAQGNIANRREDEMRRQGEAQQARARNATAEWLRANGRPDLADLLAQGGIDARTALGMAQPAAPATTDDIREYQFAQQQGYQGSFQDFMLENRRAGASNVNVSTGETGPRMGTIPQGFTAVEDPSNPSGFRLEPIPGGPAAQEAAQAAQTRERDTDIVISKGLEALDLINSVMNDPALPSITGMIQGRLPPMTQAGTNLLPKIEQLQGQAFLEAFENLKGGGQITQIEGEKATQAIARLQRTQDPNEYRKSLQDLAEVIQNGLRRAGYKPPSTNAPDFSSMSLNDLLNVDINTFTTAAEYDAYSKALEEATK